MLGDPFKPIVPYDHLHPSFRFLREDPGYAPARTILRRILAEFEDPDGNFLEQFQTAGFDARIWEVFLYTVLKNQGAKIDRSHKQPDFAVLVDGVELLIEAVTANPSPNHPSDNEIPGETLEEKVLYKQRQLRPIRLGSALFSKLQKNYWEYPHVAGKPLVFAIEDFHEPHSLSGSSSSIWQYLYGINGQWWIDESGILHIHEFTITKHSHGSKEIPSGFFSLPGVEHVSAVLFGNTGTVAKFNRMSYLEDPNQYPNIKMLRVGTRWNPDPNSPVPIRFVHEVGHAEVPVETWEEGLDIFHNPKALFPLSPGLLGIGYHYHDGVRLCSFLPDFHPFGSTTIILRGNP